VGRSNLSAAVRKSKLNCCHFCKLLPIACPKGCGQQSLGRFAHSGDAALLKPPDPQIFF
jgi:hypothetical protein